MDQQYDEAVIEAIISGVEKEHEDILRHCEKEWSDECSNIETKLDETSEERDDLDRKCNDLEYRINELEQELSDTWDALQIRCPSDHISGKETKFLSLSEHVSNLCKEHEDTIGKCEDERTILENRAYILEEEIEEEKAKTSLLEEEIEKEKVKTSATQEDADPSLALGEAVRATQDDPQMRRAVEQLLGSYHRMMAGNKTKVWLNEQ